ncbi:MAG: efflux RND transporter periplasmic adaptor subunit [Candidatus Moranbacteria bacterium]|nr:efflux RND transporter periplasmic adaptor subunit [Candidatus Moranbacteria bacterium]
MANIMSVLGKKKKYVWVIIIVLVVGGYYYYKSRQSTTGQVQYVTATAEKGTLTSSVSASGNVVVDQSSNIDPTITGTVAGLAVNVGDKVTKGQFLFSIVNDDLSVSVSKSTASLAQAQSSLESSKASKKQSSADYSDAFRSGAGKSAADKKALKDKKEAADAAVSSAEQNLIAAQADLANQRSNAAERKVISPINGTVNSVNIKNGDDLSKISSGNTRQVPIIIGDLGTMKAQVQVNEVDVANVSIGQKVMMKMDALNNIETSGVVEKMDSLGTLSSGVVTYNVTIDFDSLDPRVKPEMSVSASIITDVKQDVLTVPSSAVKSQGGTTYVEVLNGATPEQKTVTVGASNSTDTEIVSGINVGDKVVTQTINSSSSMSSTSTSSTSRTGGGGGSGLRLPGLGGGGGRPAGD